MYALLNGTWVNRANVEQVSSYYDSNLGDPFYGVRVQLTSGDAETLRFDDETTADDVARRMALGTYSEEVS